VQTDLGKPRYPKGDGFAFLSIVALCTISSISSVVMPGRTCEAAMSNTSRVIYDTQALSAGVSDKKDDRLCKLLASFLALHKTISLGAGLQPSVRALVFLLPIRAMHRVSSHSSTNRQGCTLVAEYAPEPGVWQTEDTWAVWVQ
jgi:hypothetical protein